MKIEFLLLPEDGEQSERKNEQIPCSPSQASRCWPSGHAAGGETAIARRLHGIFFLFSNPPGVYKLPAVPSGAAQGAHYPAGRYSCCHFRVRPGPGPQGRAQDWVGGPAPLWCGQNCLIAHHGMVG